MALGAASSDICSPAPNGLHNTQLLRDLLKGSILRKPLKGVKYCLFVCHADNLTLSGGEHQARARSGLTTKLSHSRGSAVPPKPGSSESPTAKVNGSANGCWLKRLVRHHHF